MCGICGFIHFNDTKIEKLATIKKMLSIIKHRGPDEEGIFIEHNIALGIQRLKVIDLETGKQPITDTTGNFTIVYNGEVYNYQEIKRTLENHGYIFKTKSDTEVVLYSYIHWGLDFVKYLNGMFALAIWDKINNRLILARDRIGIKPLFYYKDDKRLVFGSEIKAILAHPDIKREINLNALFYHFTLNFIPGNQTLFKNILHVPPANLLIVENGQIKLHRYWNIDFTKKTVHKNLNDYKEDFLNLFRDAVRLRLRSDVPLGVLLSGGIDSSSITAIAVQESTAQINTFSVGFREKSFDETRYSCLVSDHLQTNHHHILIKDNIKEILPILVNHMEEPTADSSAVPMYYLSKIARKHVTVALSGDGADEITAGYETYTATLFAKYLQRLPKIIFRVLHNATKLLPPSYKKYAFTEKAERFLRGLKNELPIAHFTWRNIIEYDSLPSIFLEGTYDQNILLKIFQDINLIFNTPANSDTLTKALYADLVYYLPNDMLIKVDRMSMANSLEVRVPFLDHRLVEFFFSIPSELKLNRYFNKKYLLRKSMAHILPKEIIKRKKSGFTVPLGKWFLTSLREITGDLINSEITKTIGFINHNYLNRLFTEHQRKRYNHGYALWSILIFLLWHKKFMNACDVL